MKDGPNIAAIAALLGDPARANMMTALMHGRALTATELAQEAGVSASTASSHLSRLEDAGLVAIEKQGRHRYFRLSGNDVAGAIESLMGVAARTGHLRVRTGPNNVALRQARVCYDHLAGDAGVKMLDFLLARKLIARRDDVLTVSKGGARFFAKFGIDMQSLENARRPLCRTCLDWSERRNHLGGALAAAVLDRIYQLGWASRDPHSRVVSFSKRGRARFDAMLAR